MHKVLCNGNISDWLLPLTFSRMLRYSLFYFILSNSRTRATTAWIGSRVVIEFQFLFCVYGVMVFFSLSSHGIGTFGLAEF